MSPASGEGYGGAFPPPADGTPEPVAVRFADPGEGYSGSFPPGEPATYAQLSGIVARVDPAEPAARARVQGRLGCFDLGPHRPGARRIDVSTPVAAVLFDFGGVLTSSPVDAVAALGPPAGLTPTAAVELVLGPLTLDSSHPFHQLERGEIGIPAYAEYLATRVAEAGLDLTYERLRDLLLALDVNEVVIDHIRLLRAQGIRTALVTNNGRDLALRWRQQLPLDELFEVVVDSSNIGIRKPNPQMLRLALDRLGLTPAEVLYLDDSLANVETARALGIRSVHVQRDPSAALVQVDALLGWDT